MRTPKDNFSENESNTIISNSISEFYLDLSKYILDKGWVRDSRIGKSVEVLNFKTVLKEPLYRCLVASERNVNIFFHIAESLWVFTGRNDLEFIRLFNSKFPKFSDDGYTLHGAYGNRIRHWEQEESSVIDQLVKSCILLERDPNTRRAVISLWNPALDLDIVSSDIPCNIQLAFKIQDDGLHLTIFNRSNDLHWGYVANVFQFSFLGEIISLLLNKRYSTQTHISQSLHVYEAYEHKSVSTNVPDLCSHFYSKYKISSFSISLKNSLSIEDKINEIDVCFNEIINMVLSQKNNDSITLENIENLILPFKNKSKSLYEIAFLLLLYLSYQNRISNQTEKDPIRQLYARSIISKITSGNVLHQDYFALALNYFVKRISNVEMKQEFTSFDHHIGKY